MYKKSKEIITVLLSNIIKKLPSIYKIQIYIRISLHNFLMYTKYTSYSFKDNLHLGQSFFSS